MLKDGFDAEPVVPKIHILCKRDIFKDRHLKSCVSKIIDKVFYNFLMRDKNISKH